MNTFLSKRLFNLPIWMDLLIKACLFSSFFTLLHLLKIDKIIDHEIRQSVNTWIVWCIFMLPYYLYKILTTFSPVDYVIFNNERSELVIQYWFLYFKRRKINLDYDAFSFGVKPEPLYLGPQKSIRIYQDKKRLIKLNARNGWSETQIDEIIGLLQNVAKIDNRKVWFLYYWK